MKYKVKAKQTYSWDYEIDADSMEDAKIKAQEYFSNNNDGATGICNVNTVDNTKFILKKLN